MYFYPIACIKENHVESHHAFCTFKRTYIALRHSTMYLIHAGFSFGGMLACYVAASLWRMSFINGDVLEKNVICITFGQPLIPILYVEEAIKDFPQFEATIHAVYEKDDFFPRVLYYYSVGCKHYYDSNQAMKTLSQTPQTASRISSSTMVNHVVHIQEIITCNL